MVAVQPARLGLGHTVRINLCAERFPVTERSSVALRLASPLPFSSERQLPALADGTNPMFWRSHYRLKRSGSVGSEWGGETEGYGLSLVRMDRVRLGAVLNWPPALARWAGLVLPGR